MAIWTVTHGSSRYAPKTNLVQLEPFPVSIVPGVKGVRVEEGDLLLLYTWGGGGWGDPYQRDAHTVALDVDRGLVSKEGALRYGVVIKSDSTVNEKATQGLRSKLIGERGEVKLFDRGFDTIDELKARCFEETGINPPKQPTFPRHIMEFLRREESQKRGVAAE